MASPKQQQHLDALPPETLAELRRAFASSAPEPEQSGGGRTEARRQREREKAKAGLGRQLRDTGRTQKVAFKMRPDVKAALAAASRKAGISETAGIERALVQWARSEGIDVAD